MSFLIKLLIAIFFIYLACVFISYETMRCIRLENGKERDKKRDIANAFIIGLPCLIFVTLSPWFSSFIGLPMLFSLSCPGGLCLGRTLRIPLRRLPPYSVRLLSSGRVQ